MIMTFNFLLQWILQLLTAQCVLTRRKTKENVKRPNILRNGGLVVVQLALLHVMSEIFFCMKSARRLAVLHVA